MFCFLLSCSHTQQNNVNGQREEAIFIRFCIFDVILDSFFICIFWSGVRCWGGHSVFCDICNSDLKHINVPLQTTNADIYCNFMIFFIGIIRMKICVKS